MCNNEKDPQLLIAVWGKEDKSRATEINTPALADYYNKHDASPALLAVNILEEILSLQLRDIAKEKHITEKDVFLVFAKRLAEYLGVSDDPALFAEFLTPAQGTSLVTVCMSDDGHLNFGVNSDIEHIMTGKASGSEIKIRSMGIEVLIIAACRLAADQIEAGEDIPEVIEYMMACFSKGMQSEIPSMKVEADITNHFVSPAHAFDDDDDKNTLPS